jgi:hypothetical protein
MVMTGSIIPQREEFSEEEPVPEPPPSPPAVEGEQPGFFDPIRQQGVLSGGVSLLGAMMPHAMIGEQIAQRATDGFQLKDVVGALGDFASVQAYAMPGIGEGLGVHHATQPDAGWIMRVLGVAGIAGTGAAMGLGAAAHAVPQGGIALNSILMLGPVGRAGPNQVLIPRIVASTSNDTLAALSGTMREPMIAGLIIPTTGGVARRSWMSLAKSGFGTDSFDEASAMRGVREAVIGRHVKTEWVPRKKNAATADDFFMGLGRDLFEQIPDYLASKGNNMTPEQIRVAAVALEVSKFDHLVSPKKGWNNKGVLRLGKDMPPVDEHFKKLVAGEALSAVEQAELRAAIIQFAKVTMGNGHPELALQDIRASVAAVFLGSDPENPGRVYLSFADWDARSLSNMNEAEFLRRVTSAFEMNPVQIIPFQVNNVTDFFKSHVLDPNTGAIRKELDAGVMRPAATHPALKDARAQVVPVEDMKRFAADVTDDVRALSDDIRGSGIKEALILEYNPKTGAAALVDGQKRLAAAEMRGLEAVPVRVVVNTALEGPAVPGLKKFKTNVPESVVVTDIGSGKKALRKAPAPFQGIIPESQRAMDQTVAWYKIAGDDLGLGAIEIGISQRKLVGVASLMSAGELWEQNIEKAIAAARYVTDHPNVTAVQLQSHMNDIVGIKATKSEANNVITFLKKTEKEAESFFLDKMTGRQTLKQPNFVEAILQSKASDIEKHQGIVYGLMTGEIDTYNAKYLFGELDQELPGVMDRHAFAISMGGTIVPDTRMSNNMYRATKRAYEVAAEQIGEVQFSNGDVRRLSPTEVQALEWVAWREWKGVTKNFKTYNPEAFKNLSAPSNWIHGQGPAKIFNDRIFKAIETPLPPAFTHRNLAAQTNPTWRYPKALKGRVQSGSQRFGTGLGVSVRQTTLSYGADGLQVQAPPGTHMTGGYGSFGYSPNGQDIRPRQAMIVADARVFYKQVLAADTETLTKGVGFTGSRIKLLKTMETQPGLDGGLAISVSVPSVTNQGIPGRRAHKQMSARMQERGIEHELILENGFEGRSTVWVDDDGTHYWSRADVEEAGFNPDMLEKTDDVERRSGGIFRFEDPVMMQRARNFMHSANPHLEEGHVPAAAAAKQGYLDTWADVHGLGPIRGIKKELAHRGVARETEGVRSPLERTQADSAIGRRTANAYEAAPTKMTDADVGIYDQMINEVDAQYQYITRTMGIEVEVVNTNPYANPLELAADIRDNNRLKVLSSESTGGHPYMTNAQNDQFRAVHDFFGHTVMGNSFTRHGEEAAYLIHAQMFSEGARGAVHSETAGQNAWLNYSKKNRAKARKALRQGLSYEGQFGEQKAVVLPKDLWSDKTLAAHPGLLKGSDQGRMIDHVYNEQILDFVMYGNGERIPPGMTEAFEHVYRDNVNAVFHMSTEGDPNAANTVRAWVESDGLLEYFKDSTTGRYTTQGGAHTYRKINGRMTWDGVADVVNPQVVDDFNVPNVHPFDVTIDGKRVSEIAVHLPLEGTGQVQMALGQTTIPGADPSRVVVWRLTSRGTADTFSSGGFRSEVEVPDVRNNQRMDPTLKDEMVQFINRTGWKGGSGKGKGTVGLPAFKVAS